MKFKKLIAGIILGIISLSMYAENTINVPISNNRYEVFLVSESEPSKEYDLEITGGKFVIDIHTVNSLPSAILVSPSGVTYGASEFSTLVIAEENVMPLTSIYFEKGNHAQIELDNAEIGTWVLTLTHSGVEEDILGNITVINTNSIGVAAFSSRSVYNTEMPVYLGAALFNNTVPVVGTVHANVYSEDGELIASVDLKDDGAGSDTSGGDGLYSAVLDALGVGSYVVRVEALVNEQSLISSASFNIESPLAQILESSSDTALDTNGDGLFEEVVVTVPVEVYQAGTYAVIGKLVLDDLAISVGNQAQLESGTKEVKLDFTANSIKTYLKADGPYEIKDVVLTLLNDGSGRRKIADRRSSLGFTQGYQIGDLQRDDITIGNSFISRVEDTNGNNLYDYLYVDLDVNFLKSGSYNWSASLQSSDEVDISLASSNGYYQAGDHIVTLRFEGRNIGESEINGPYHLNNFAIYGQNGSTTVIEYVGVTSEYSAYEFEGSQVTFARLRTLTENLVITGIGGIPRAEGIRTSLLKKIDNAASLHEADLPAAKKILQAFISEVQAQTDKHIRESDAANIIDVAERLLNSI